MFAGSQARPDLEACVASGVFDICVEAVTAFADAGVAGLKDTNHAVLSMSLGVLGKCSAEDGCEAKVRDIASELAFVLENDLDYLADLGYTTGAMAAKVCCNVFGRDEGGSEFLFTPQHIALLTENWSQRVRGDIFKGSRPTADTIFAVELCVSDANKPLLISNEEFVPYCVDALLLDPDHPRAGMKEEHKSWCQHHHTEALAQLAMFELSREALLRDESVVPALEMVAKAGLSEAARELAAAALLALSDKELERVKEGQKHVMLSCKFVSDRVAPARSPLPVLAFGVS